MTIEAAPLRLLTPAARPTRSATPHPRMDRGGLNCRVLLTSDMLAEIGEAPTPTSCALIRNHPADLAVAARHVDLYDRLLTRAGSGTAHKARGTSRELTREGIAAFMAGEVRR